MRRRGCGRNARAKGACVPVRKSRTTEWCPTLAPHLLALLFACLLACVIPCLLPCLLACLPARPPACLPADLPACPTTSCCFSRLQSTFIPFRYGTDGDTFRVEFRLDQTVADIKRTFAAQVTEPFPLTPDMVRLVFSGTPLVDDSATVASSRLDSGAGRTAAVALA